MIQRTAWELPHRNTHSACYAVRWRLAGTSLVSGCGHCIPTSHLHMLVTFGRIADVITTQKVSCLRSTLFARCERSFIRRMLLFFCFVMWHPWMIDYPESSGHSQPRMTGILTPRGLILQRHFVPELRGTPINQRTSVAVSAETPLRSPQKLFIFVIKNIFFGSKYPSIKIIKFWQKTSMQRTLSWNITCIHTKSDTFATSDFAFKLREILRNFNPEISFLAGWNKLNFGVTWQIYWLQQNQCLQQDQRSFRQGEQSNHVAEHNTWDMSVMFIGII